MVEPEIAFADLQDNLAFAEKFLKSIFTTVLNERADDMEFFAQWIHKEAITRLTHFIETPFQVLEYGDAISKLQDAKTTFEFAPTWGADLQSEHEKYLCELTGAPTAIINYPEQIKSFYMRLNDDEKTVAAMDILAPGIGEIVGGSQREERLDYLDKRMEKMDIDPTEYSWYRDLRKYGTVPHAGFGLGLERAIQYATGVENIRDVIPFPRTPRNADF